MPVHSDAPQRRRSVRLKGYDYGQPGAYFVTIVTQERLPLFGEVVGEAVELSAAGQMIADVWNGLPGRFPGTKSGTYVVMPNHFHGILVIRDAVGATFMVAPQWAGMNPAPTPTPPNARGQPSLGRIVGAFKSLTTLHYMNGIKIHGWTPFVGRLWQRGYYDHVIRSDAEWNRIHLYIEANPANWIHDSENSSSVALPGNRPHDL